MSDDLPGFRKFVIQFMFRMAQVGDYVYSGSIFNLKLSIV